MAKYAVLGLALMVAGGTWFACGKNDKSSSKKSSGTATATETATDTATESETDTSSNTATETSGIACQHDSACTLKSADGTVVPAAFECCAACDCEQGGPVTKDGMVALCAENQCAALPYAPADDEAKCTDLKPTDQPDAVCVNTRCNVQPDKFVWMHPVDAAKQKALCRPCPEC